MNKAELIRHEIEKRRVHNLAIGNPLFSAMAEEDIELLCFIDSLQEEPVSDELEKVVEEIVDPTVLNAYGVKEIANRLRRTMIEPVSEELEKAAEEYIEYTPRYDIGYELEEGNDPTEIDCFTIDEATAAFIEGAKWQKAKDESTTEDLGEYINELSKQFPEVSFAKLSRIAVRVAKWQTEQFEKERLKHCDALTKEQAQIESDFVINHLKKNNRTPTFIDAIEYGMEYAKEQMLKDAVEAAVTDIRTYKNENEVDFSVMYEKGIIPYELEQEVKLIIVKEG